MLSKKLISISITVAILLIGISVFYYFVVFLPKNSQKVNFVDEVLKCSQLYELKKVKYWGEEIGQNETIYNSGLNTCLVLNIYNDFDTDEYFAAVINMVNNKTLLYFNSKPKGSYFEGENSDKKITCEVDYVYFRYIKDGREIEEYGCEKYDLMDKMFKQVRGFGFKL